MHTPDEAALEIYDLAHADPENPPGPVALACALLGRPDAVQRTRVPMPASASAVYRAHHGVILVRHDATPTAISYLVGHELAEMYLGASRARDRERLCDAIGAALVLPEPAVRLSLAHGRDGAALARRFRTTQSIAWLRIGEVLQVPTALVLPNRVRVTAQGWPRDLRAQALGRRPTSLFRQGLSDAPGRVVVTAR